MPFTVVKLHSNATVGAVGFQACIVCHRKTYDVAGLARLLCGKIREHRYEQLPRQRFRGLRRSPDVAGELRRHASSGVIAYELDKPYHVVVELRIREHRLSRGRIQLVCKTLVHVRHDVYQNREIGAFIHLIRKPAVFRQLAGNQLLHRISRKPQKIYITVSHVSNSLQLLLIYLPLNYKIKARKQAGFMLIIAQPISIFV